MTPEERCQVRAELSRQVSRLQAELQQATEAQALLDQFKDYEASVRLIEQARERVDMGRPPAPYV